VCLALESLACRLSSSMKPSNVSALGGDGVGVGVDSMVRVGS
jgi:hypothetical protein